MRVNFCPFCKQSIDRKNCENCKNREVKPQKPRGKTAVGMPLRVLGEGWRVGGVRSRRYGGFTSRFVVPFSSNSNR